MSTLKEEYMHFKRERSLGKARLTDIMQRQWWLRENYNRMVVEERPPANAGLFSNVMSGLALGFAFYDCRPTPWCSENCYGLHIGGVFDYNMLRLSVMVSESLRISDPRILGPLAQEIRSLQVLKIGHWGDAELEQLPNLLDMVAEARNTQCWWYTRKPEIAAAVNECHLPNVRAYLSLDPSSTYPDRREYPYGFTYVFGRDSRHPRHEEILSDERLVAVFPRKKGVKAEDPGALGVAKHNRICIEKMLRTGGRQEREGICLRCRGRCNFSGRQTPAFLLPAGG
jgi:hypothetical protein